MKGILNSIRILSPLMLLLTLTAHADNSIHSGEGTFYGYGGGGNCSFPKPDYILTAAMNATDYANSEACGGVIVVTNEATGLSVTVRVDDQCPECAPGDVDLSQEAFAQISDISAGRIPIRWHYAANEQAGNMKLYFKEGSSQWWTAVQVRDHLYPVTKLEYRISGSGNNYVALPREPYNYFVATSGFGVGPYDFRITDFWGQVVEVGGISLALTTEIDTGKQFPHSDADVPEEPGDDSTDTGGTDTGDTETYPADVEATVINSWDGGYCSNVTVTNPNDTVLEWAVSMDITGSVDSVWNANWNQSGSVLEATGVGWNASLEAGASTEFGYCATH